MRVFGSYPNRGMATAKAKSQGQTERSAHEAFRPGVHGSRHAHRCRSRGDVRVCRRCGRHRQWWQPQLRRAQQGHRHDQRCPRRSDARVRLTGNRHRPPCRHQRQRLERGLRGGNTTDDGLQAGLEGQGFGRGSRQRQPGLPSMYAGDTTDSSRHESSSPAGLAQRARAAGSARQGTRSVQDGCQDELELGDG